jgi:hypothetical protein
VTATCPIPPHPFPLSKVSAATLLGGWLLLSISALLLSAWALAPRRLFARTGFGPTPVVQAAAGRLLHRVEISEVNPRIVNYSHL